MIASSDNLLNDTVQAKCNPVPSTQAPNADQSPQDNFSTASGTSDQPIILQKDDSTDTADHTIQPEAKSKVPQTDEQSVSHYSRIQACSSDVYNLTSILPDNSRQEQCYHDQSIVVTSQFSSIDTNEPFQIMLRCNDKLVTALSIDPQGLAGTLLAKGLIPEHTESQIRQCPTPREKAIILVTTVRQRISIAPKRFHEFLDILSEHTWTKDIVEVLLSCTTSKWLSKDAGIQAVTTGPSGQSSTDDEHKSDHDIGEDNPIPKLNSEELEAQLILSANSMRKKFASLLLKVVTSFKRQGIDPRELATAILALTEYDDPAIGKPLLERDKEALMRAQTVDHTFDILRPHMTFFNYEILEFLIEEMGSRNDKCNLQNFLQEFIRFCSRSVFEIPPNMLGHSEEKAADQQKFCVKITKQFKVALLVQTKEYDQQAGSSSPTSSNHEEKERICAPELGICLDDAKHIQRKLATVLKLKASSIYLDSAALGSVILTFLLPSHISLAGLDSNPDAIALSGIGIHILCGPPGKPESKELSSKGLVVQWSQPEYGCNTLTQYMLYYQSKDSETVPLNDWQKIKLSSQWTHTCVPDLSDGDTYVFRVSSVSDAGTLQYSDKSDPILISALTGSISKAKPLTKSSTDSWIGSESYETYGTVQKHLLMPNFHPDEEEEIEQFSKGWILLSKFDHPNIVHYIQDEDPQNLSPIMESMHMDLETFLTTKREIPLSVKLSILLDISSGLVYLHTQLDEPVIHCDLRPSNVLLTTDLRAKIADFSVAKIVQREMVHTKCPGTMAYMPPEVLFETPECSPNLDIFSFGQLTLYVANQRFPEVYDVSNSDMINEFHSALDRGEVQLLKRRRWIEILQKQNHCLLDIIQQCLQDNPRKRPTSKDISHSLKTLCMIHPKSLEDIVSVWDSDDVKVSNTYSAK